MKKDRTFGDRRVEVNASLPRTRFERYEAPACFWNLFTSLGEVTPVPSDTELHAHHKPSWPTWLHIRLKLETTHAPNRPPLLQGQIGQIESGRGLVSEPTDHGSNHHSYGSNDLPEFIQFWLLLGQTKGLLRGDPSLDRPVVTLI